MLKIDSIFHGLWATLEDTVSVFLKRFKCAAGHSKEKTLELHITNVSDRVVILTQLGASHQGDPLRTKCSIGPFLVALRTLK